MPPTAGTSQRTIDAASLNNGRRPFWRDLAILAALAAVVYFFGLTDYGVDSFQEGTRLCVAYEMQQAGEWIVPTRGGEVYVAKPPMMYWVVMGVAKLRGGTVDLIDARIAIASAGLLGVICMYVVARRMLATPDRPREGDDAAWWATLGLATGILYVRAARIADLDMLLIPFVVVAIGAVHAAWMASIEQQRTHWAALGLATACSIGAALTKGPVPTMVIGLAIYAPIIAHGCWEARSAMRQRGGSRPLAFGIGGVAALAGMWLASYGVESGGDWPGVLVLGLAMGGLAYAAVRALEPSAARAWWTHLRRTHPWLVLGAGLVVIALWLMLVDARIGDAAIGELVDDERDNNLQLLSPRSPIRNLGFFGYGILPMSLAGIAGLVWIVRDRPVLTPGQRSAVLWTVLGFVAFSVLGKGVARYLLPVWPGMAMLGGMWLVAALRDLAKSAGQAAQWRVVVLGVFVIAAVGNAWFYGMGRAWLAPEGSPEAMVGELVAEHRVHPARVGTVGFGSPALNFHLADALPGWDGEHMYFVEYWSWEDYWGEVREGTGMDELLDRVREAEGDYWLFVESRGFEGVWEELERRAPGAEVVPLEAAWVRNSRSGFVKVVRLPGGAGGNSHDRRGGSG